MSALLFDGTNSYAKVADNDIFSVTTTGEITVSVWIRPDTLEFPVTSGSGDKYVNFLGKSQFGSPNTRVVSTNRQAASLRGVV
jgi:hypothetical protein